MFLFFSVVYCILRITFFRSKAFVGWSWICHKLSLWFSWILRGKV